MVKDINFIRGGILGKNLQSSVGNDDKVQCSENKVEIERVMEVEDPLSMKGSDKGLLRIRLGLKMYNLLVNGFWLKK